MILERHNTLQYLEKELFIGMTKTQATKTHMVVYYLAVPMAEILQYTIVAGIYMAIVISRFSISK